ncbi:ANTH domain-containing protein [Cladochytrium replicatum]|nr:ANTH domain-containing protein [Cladochytrium replicatum]
MVGDFERSVSKSTSKKLQPLKPKHVHVIMTSSFSPGVVNELLRVINYRIRESHWVVTFKALIIVHMLMREGDVYRVFQNLATSPGILNVAGLRDKSSDPLGASQFRNIRLYAAYLEEKVVAYRETQKDFVHEKAEMVAKFRSIPIGSGLFKDIKYLQQEIDALLNCTFYLGEIDNVVTLQAFRLLLADLMSLFHLLNEGVIRILGSYFEMTKQEATESLAIYKRFASQTKKAVEFFDTAKSLRGQLGVEIPTFNHAPVSLSSALEEYLRAPDFEAQRQAYKDRKIAKSEKPKTTTSSAAPSSTSSSAKSAPKTHESQQKAAPNSDTVDFFTSINQEVNQLNAISQNNANAMKQFDGFAAFGISGLNSSPFSVAQQTNPFGQGTMDANLMAAQNLQMQQLQLQQQQQQMLLQQQIQQQQLQQNQLLLPGFGNGASTNPFLATGMTGMQLQTASSPQPNFNTIDFTPENVFSNPAVFSSSAGAVAGIAPSVPNAAMRVNSLLPMAKTPSAPPASIDPFGTLTKSSIGGGNFPVSGAYPGLNNVANTNPFAAVQMQQQQQRSVSMPVPTNNPFLQQNNFG